MCVCVCMCVSIRPGYSYGTATPVPLFVETHKLKEEIKKDNRDNSHTTPSLPRAPPWTKPSLAQRGRMRQPCHD